MGAAAAANTLNQWREVHQDSLMKRTARRPLPLGRISRLHALAFAGVAGAAGVAILGTQVPAQHLFLACYTQPIRDRLEVCLVTVSF